MKKGDLLLCNDKKTTVKIIDLDNDFVYVLYKGKRHKRPISHIGQSLHRYTRCWNCREPISPILCQKCRHCGGEICPSCGSCHKNHCQYGDRGFNKEGIHRNGTRFSDGGYDINGFDPNGYNKDGYDRCGYDSSGYDLFGYDKNGYDKNGYDGYGYNKDGYNKNGYDRSGYNKDGYDKNGYDRCGYDKYGYDKRGCDRVGRDRCGYDKYGYDRSGYKKDGYDKNGYNKKGFNRQGINKDGLTKEWADLINAWVIYKGQHAVILSCVLKNDLHLVRIRTLSENYNEEVYYENATAAGLLVVDKKAKKNSH